MPNSAVYLLAIDVWRLSWYGVVNNMSFRGPFPGRTFYSRMRECPRAGCRHQLRAREREQRGDSQCAQRVIDQRM